MNTFFRPRTFLTATLGALAFQLVTPPAAFAELRVGAAVVDISPTQMPVLVNGGMTSRTASEIRTTVNARAMVISDDQERIALVVVDSCMVPKEILDDAKQRAASRTELQPDRIMISATHTHTAPSAFGALGTNADTTYVPLLREKIVESIVQAEANLQAAKVGWGSADAGEFTALRRWVRRPDRIELDPFGNPTTRANMHAARNQDDVTGPSGPEDPELSMIAFQSTAGDPIAILANFSMHYFGDKPISADYFGLFSDGIANYAASKQPSAKPAVGIMSHGCSGDIWRRDYFTFTGKDPTTIDGYTQGLLEIAKEVYDSIEYQGDVDIAMAEARLPLRYRVPDAQRLQWARQIVAELNGELPKTREQVYAREQVFLHELQATEVVVQAMRIGDIGIATTPNETYALTGYKLKLQSPLKHTMVIELANGADGYIPSPEQHALGGYNTWAARSAGLEVQAEPKIAAVGLDLLEQVAGKPRQPYTQSRGPTASAISGLEPVAYWRLDEMDAAAAVDSSGNHHDGIYEQGVLFFLEGPQDAGYTQSPEINRCAHFAGGRVRARIGSLRDKYTVLLSLWNGMPSDGRETSGWFFSRDHAHRITSRGEHFGIGGTATKPGVLIFQQGTADPAVGSTPLQRWSWNRVALVRDGDRVRVYLNGSEKPEIDIAAGNASQVHIPSVFIGGRSDNESNWEGRIDEVAIFDKPLSGTQIRTLVRQE
jgi:hypothetical protein